ncbi:MAG: sensor histidine kinase, partial [Methanobacteriota archaeon]
ITERKYMDESLQEAVQKLRLLSGLTRHDILNQVSAVQLLQEMALNTSIQKKVNEYISQAQEATAQIEATIGFTREYENFGSVSSGWKQIYLIIEGAKTEIPLGHVTMENLVPEGLEVYADPIIRKVFSTLMDNAVRHGGEITRIRIFCHVTPHWLTIICDDDGMGIPTLEKERIFDHSYGKNTGLGLFLAREILSITGLSIHECGEPGKGARFEILVPEGKFRQGEK